MFPEENSAGTQRKDIADDSVVDLTDIESPRPSTSSDRDADVYREKSERNICGPETSQGSSESSKCLIIKKTDQNMPGKLGKMPKSSQKKSRNKGSSGKDKGDIKTNGMIPINTFFAKKEMESVEFKQNDTSAFKTLNN